jgi:FkbM family methyltransferase
MFISYAQNFEDVILNRVFKHKKNGFYIDVGANHPIYDSVTMAFYERGWRGINIEPIPSQFELFVKDRPRDINLNIAISEDEKSLEFFDLKGTGFSTLDKQIAISLMEEKALELDTYYVDARSLLSVCLEFVNTPIDFLKIDVEGWEEYVVNSHDWRRFRPTVVIVEATFPGKPQYRQTNTG